MAKKNNGVGKIVKTGVAISAVAGAAYMLFGPDGKKHQKKLHDWAMKVQKEVKKDVKVVKKVVAKEMKAMNGEKKAVSKKK
jgi:hypothetical protein